MIMATQTTPQAGFLPFESGGIPQPGPSHSGQHQSSQHPPPPPPPPHLIICIINLPPSATPSSPLVSHVPLRPESKYAAHQTFETQGRLGFGYHPLEHRRTPSPVENWYNSLIIHNVRRQGVMDMYANLDRQEFVLPTLSLASALLDGLIEVFGNKYTPQQQVAKDPDTMEIDAARVAPFNAPSCSLLNASWALCWARQLCFRCLSPIVAGLHTGSLNCPNNPISPEQREAFIKRCHPNQTPLATVALINSPQEVTPSPPLTYHTTHPPAPSAPVALEHKDFLSHQEVLGFDEVYKEYEEAECAPVTIPISTVHIQLDRTVKGCLLVPVSFKDVNGSLFPATVLVDTGAMANFVNKGFVRRHALTLQQRKTPIRCVGFNGQEAVGGVVTEDWAGCIQLLTVDLTPFTLPSSFGVTRLGSVDAIFGLPWLDKQGWVASGSLKGGNQFTLGSTPLYVVKTVSVGGKPGDKLYTSPS
ncbi:hypothetical protein PCANC_01715 [Puccinia coronata f. sp. avenae]|uniref:Uncharacterized protein n=1 Tax=Puccinia coronata f. sp. avenae TaxID=200324 RepID=A0A2N5W3D9_9BASI|nr:hypothetical protein PCANC_01715 [Puccinia coronata f. sp. avenae]